MVVILLGKLQQELQQMQTIILQMMEGLRHTTVVVVVAVQGNMELTVRVSQ